MRFVNLIPDPYGAFLYRREGGSGGWRKRGEPLCKAEVVKRTDHISSSRNPFDTLTSALDKIFQN